MRSSPQFIVVGFDFGGSLSVCLHACTSDEQGARAVYARLAEKYGPYNQKHGAQGSAQLIELVRVEPGFCKEHTFFWGNGDVKGVTVLETNNGSWES